jgi:hypothetical protein
MLNMLVTRSPTLDAYLAQTILFMRETGQLYAHGDTSLVISILTSEQRYQRRSQATLKSSFLCCDLRMIGISTLVERKQISPARSLTKVEKGQYD